MVGADGIFYLVESKFFNRNPSHECYEEPETRRQHTGRHDHSRGQQQQQQCQRQPTEPAVGKQPRSCPHRYRDYALGLSRVESLPRDPIGPSHRRHYLVHAGLTFKDNFKLDL